MANKHTYYFCGADGEEYVFVPARSIELSQVEYFGGYQVAEPDTRSFEDLQTQSQIPGLQMNEGGASPITLAGHQLFRTRAEACHAAAKKNNTP